MKYRINRGALFIKRCIASPKTMGAVAPSSPILAKHMAKSLRYKPGQKIVELGAGTGSLTEGFIREGVISDDIYPIEIDPSLCKILEQKFRNVICGNAEQLHEILPIEGVDTIVSGLPLMIFSKESKYKIIQSCKKVLKPNGRLLQFTYGFKSPIDHETFGLRAKRLSYVVLNFPPAFIWEFRVK